MLAPNGAWTKPEVDVTWLAGVTSVSSIQVPADALRRLTALLHNRRMKPVPPIRLGISSCLLGQKVRYDGNHRHDQLHHRHAWEILSEFVPVCPEVAIGLGVPRPPILAGRQPGRAVRAVGGGCDLTLMSPACLLFTGSAWRARLTPSAATSLKAAARVADGACKGRRWPRSERPGGRHGGVPGSRQPLLPVEEEGRPATPSCATTSSSACSPIAAGRR